jgi:hypothetical protein
MKIRVVASWWTIEIHSDKDFANLFFKEYGRCHAVTIIEDKKIHVRVRSLNKISLIHELVHAYQEEMSFWELQLDDDQVEEFFCELWAKYGEKISANVRRFFKAIKSEGLLDERNKPKTIHCSVCKKARSRIKQNPK